MDIFSAHPCFECKCFSNKKKLLLTPGTSPQHWVDGCKGHAHPRRLLSGDEQCNSEIAHG